MKDRYWILTYDIASQIEELYKNQFYTKYYLNYSIATPTKGQEFMFFSNKTNKGDIQKFLNFA
ncbi:hypothetical protein D3C76_1636180 [compost metagenome]